ncbi:hypothetical protein AMD27_11225 [Acinetobacter sp. TGL-Y2]|uniref:hypothetical protein n=1 Tax=Acinetobacter sp. TGL-Y2 TaxID=1407071 RepID=UPI0007A64C15|nr:hypothetical protein [Acinetobacter sp. TGL-Y2]AMW80406.1 hypothetical protein AMD27_11225 [Acinetobacter sp. TGL-Y2]
MSKPAKKLTPKFILLICLGPLIPALIIAIAFFAIKSDAKNQAKYDRLRAEQAMRIEAKAQADKLKTADSEHESQAE